MAKHGQAKMNNVSLLEKTRMINRSIQQSAGFQVDFAELAGVLSQVTGSSVFILSRKGKLLGAELHPTLESSVGEEELMGEGRVQEELNDQLLGIEQTQEATVGEWANVFSGKSTITVPLSGGGERLGTLIATRTSRPFTDDDLVLAEYGATVVAMEILRSRSEQIEDEVRKKAACQVAIGTLSYSEHEAVVSIFAELAGNEGLLVASKVADAAGITRSVIVNALRKLESAGVIESRSLGMKGTYLRVLNPYFLEELKRIS